MNEKQPVSSLSLPEVSQISPAACKKVRTTLPMIQNDQKSEACLIPGPSENKKPHNISTPTIVPSEVKPLSRLFRAEEPPAKDSDSDSETVSTNFGSGDEGENEPDVRFQEHISDFQRPHSAASHFFDSQQLPASASVPQNKPPTSPPPQFVAPYGRQFVGDEHPPPEMEFELDPEVVQKLFRMNAQQLMIYLADRIFRLESQVNRLETNQQYIKENLKSLSSSQAANIQPTMDEIPSPLNELPLNEVAGVKALDAKLRVDKEYRQKVFQKLKFIGGSSSGDIICNILRAVFSNKVGMEYTYGGHKGREKMKALLVMDMMKYIVRLQYKISDTEIKNEVNGWVKNAKKRFKTAQKKEEERMREQNEENIGPNFI